MFGHLHDFIKGGLEENGDSLPASSWHERFLLCFSKNCGRLKSKPETSLRLSISRAISTNCICQQSPIQVPTRQWIANVRAARESEHDGPITFKLRLITLTRDWAV